ncbi:hypothetical protein [Putridiphycobacter roseus]|uniref:hypothetical protein n=1 Tax=Putridiphycobacter roseus TaxID=2219161 RepID=UPI00362EA657
MAATETVGGAEGTEEVACARDFVADRLAEAESPVTPSGLASEYGCSNGHIRNILADLLDEGEAERVGRGQYVEAGSGPADAEADVVTDFEPENYGVADATTSDAGTDSSPDPSADGGPRSEDLDTTDEDDQGDGETEPVGEIEDEPVTASGGIPLPVSTTTLAVGVVLALLVVWWVTRDRGGQDDENEQQTNAATAPNQRNGGLMG